MKQGAHTPPARAAPKKQAATEYPGTVGGCIPLSLGRGGCGWLMEGKVLESAPAAASARPPARAVSERVPGRRKVLAGSGREKMKTRSQDPRCLNKTGKKRRTKQKRLRYVYVPVLEDEPARGLLDEHAPVSGGATP
jgi:hypothetical protein